MITNGKRNIHRTPLVKILICEWCFRKSMKKGLCNYSHKPFMYVNWEETASLTTGGTDG